MGIGKSLKKFVKKAAPIVGAVAPFFLGPAAGAFVGAATGAMGGGGLKGALMGGLGGYAAGGFGQGVKAAGGLGSLFNPAAGPHTPGFLGRLGNLAKAGMRGVQQTPLGQGIGSMVNKFTGATGITGQGFTPGQPLPGGQEFMVKTKADEFGRERSFFTTADDVLQKASQGIIDTNNIVNKDGDNVSISSILGMYQQGQGQGQGGGIMNWIKNNPNLAYGLGAGAAQFLENRANPQFEVSMGQGLDYDTGRGTAVKDPVLTADFANGGRTGYANGNEIEMMPIDNKAIGGIIGLANGGEPTHEMDLRGGGFIPVGAYERADDVPARVSKNEFVMTADAVRAAGGGSIDRGSQRMYDLMNRLEGVA